MRAMAIAVAMISTSFFAPAIPGAAQNLLENGDFEATLGTGNSSGTGGFGPFVRFVYPNQGIPSWTLTEGTVEVFTDYRGSGGQVVDVTGLHTGLGPGTIEQSFATTLGATYDVAFSMGGCCTPVIKEMAVSVVGTGAPLFSATFSFDVATAPTPGDLAPLSFDFVADGNTSTIRFESLVDSDFDGPYLDDVVVTEAPEAGAAGAFLVACAVLRALAARQSRRGAHSFTPIVIAPAAITAE